MFLSLQPGLSRYFYPRKAICSPCSLPRSITALWYNKINVYKGFLAFEEDFSSSVTRNSGADVSI